MIQSSIKEAFQGIFPSGTLYHFSETTFFSQQLKEFQPDFVLVDRECCQGIDLEQRVGVEVLPRPLNPREVLASLENGLFPPAIT